MSTVVSISVCNRSSEIIGVFAGLVERLLEPTSITAQIYAGGSTHRHHVDPADVLADVEQFGSAILPSSNALVLSGVVQLAHDVDLTVDLDLYGSNYYGGGYARGNGHVRLTVANLATLISSERRPVHLPMVYGLQDKDVLELTIAEELFVRVCGLMDTQNDDRPSVEHAAMYAETGWPGPADCSMLYHRDVSEFARDFGRMYADYHYGILSAELLQSGRNLWDLSVSDLTALTSESPPKTEAPRTFASWETPNPEVPLQREFLDQLDEQTARRLSLVHEESMFIGVRAACSDTEHVVCYAFGSYGGVVAANPLTRRGELSTIWRFYDSFARST